MERAVAERVAGDASGVEGSQSIPARVAKGDAGALERATRLARPVSLAGEHLLPVTEALLPLLPDAGLRRGTVAFTTGVS